MKILVAIKTGVNTFSRIDTLEKTWAKDCDHLYFSDYEDEKYDMIKTTSNTTYYGVGEKGINFLNLVKDIESSEGKILDIYDWIFYVDDDTFVNVNNLQEFVKTADNNKVYGYIFQCPRNQGNPVFDRKIISKTSKFPSGGAGVLIGSKVFRKISKFDLFTVPSLGHDDVDMGLNFDMYGIEQVDSNLFNSQAPTVYNHDDEDIKKSVTYHKILGDEMISLYEKTK